MKVWPSIQAAIDAGKTDFSVIQNCTFSNLKGKGATIEFAKKEGDVVISGCMFKGSKIEQQDRA